VEAGGLANPRLLRPCVMARDYRQGLNARKGAS
jgi:hypothetical protein